MATIKVCDLCDKRGAKTFSFFNGDSWSGGHKSEPAYDTYDFCEVCLLTLTLNLIKNKNLEPELCKVLQDRLRSKKK